MLLTPGSLVTLVLLDVRGFRLVLARGVLSRYAVSVSTGSVDSPGWPWPSLRSPSELMRDARACDSDQTLVTKSTSTVTTTAASTHHITAVALVPSHASSCC
jgi:hypothetical protein